MWLILLWLSVASWAQEAPQQPWYLNLPVAQVRLLQDDGIGLPDESLTPLLRTRQDQRLDTRKLRQDLVTLYRVGEFATVQADVEPWINMDENGDIQHAVVVTFAITAAPRIAKLQLQGLEEADENEVRLAAQLSKGNIFFPEIDTQRTVQHVLTYLESNGFPSAQVEVDSYPIEDHKLEVWIRLNEGTPDTLHRLRFKGDLPVSRRRLRRIVRKTGLVEGKPISSQAVSDAQAALRTDLAEKGNWVSARITPLVRKNNKDQRRVVFLIEPGAALQVDVNGYGFGGRDFVKTTLGINERLRLTRGFLEDAPLQLKDALEQRGFLEPDVTVALLKDSDQQTLRIDINKGPRYRLKDILFSGNTHLSDKTLRTLFEQASPDVLRLRRVSIDEIEKALAATETVYESEGYLQAQLTTKDLATKQRHFFKRPTNKQVTLSIEIEEGARTHVGLFEIRGSAAGVELTSMELAGKPFSPQKLEQAALKLAERHRKLGYLDVKVQQVHDVQEQEQANASLMVDPGPQVRLRSIVTRGAVNSDMDFVRSQTSLKLGAQLTPETMEQARSRLYALGMFRSISMNLYGDRAGRDLVISVNEQPRWGLEIALGASTDEGARAFFRTTRRNIAGRGQVLEFYGVAGIGYRSGQPGDWALDFASPEWRAALTYRTPSFIGLRQEFITELLFREIDQEQTWELARTGLSMTLNTPSNQRLRLRAGIHIEQRRLNEVEEGALLDDELWSQMLQGADNLASTASITDEALQGLLIYDARDHPLLPTRGLRLSFATEFHPGLSHALAKTQQVPRFLKGELKLRGHLPLGRLSLETQLSGGGALIAGDGVVPLEERYRLGGTGSFRGFIRDSLGPKNRVVKDSADGSENSHFVPTGGDTYALATLELLVPLSVLGMRAWEDYAVALFSDVGNTWLLRGSTTSTQGLSIDFDPLLRSSVGLGARMGTPIGPLRIDFASNLSALTASPTIRRFLKEEYNEKRLRLHLSLGTLF